jgi:hypothetical protein
VLDVGVGAELALENGVHHRYQCSAGGLQRQVGIHNLKAPRLDPCPEVVARHRPVHRFTSWYSMSSRTSSQPHSGSV